MKKVTQAEQMTTIFTTECVSASMDCFEKNKGKIFIFTSKTPIGPCMRLVGIPGLGSELTELQHSHYRDGNMLTCQSGKFKILKEERVSETELNRRILSYFSSEGLNEETKLEDFEYMPKVRNTNNRKYLTPRERHIIP